MFESKQLGSLFGSLIGKAFGLSNGFLYNLLVHIIEDFNAADKICRKRYQKPGGFIVSIIRNLIDSKTDITFPKEQDNLCRGGDYTLMLAFFALKSMKINVIH